MGTQGKSKSFEKFPKWVQEHIERIERERDQAVLALNQYVDSQTTSQIFYDDAVCTGEGSGPSFKRVYVQSSDIQIHYAGVHLDVSLVGDCIKLKWEGFGGKNIRVGFIPTTYCGEMLLALKQIE